MFKKIFKFTLLIIFIGFISAFIRGFTYHNKKYDEKNENITEVQTSKQDLINEEFISSTRSSNESEQNSSDKEIIKNEKSDNSKDPIANNPNKTNEVKTNENEIINNNVAKIQEQNDVLNNDISTQNSDSSNNDTIIQNQVPTIDEEYINLLNFVDYKADEYGLCYNASIDVALSDTVNIRNTACKQFAYNGELVGYKIQIFYRDGTYKYYNN